MSGDLAEIFSRKTRVGGIGLAPAARRIEALADECKALAAVFGLPAIASLAGDFTLEASPGSGGAIKASLALHARITQICVISLQPFETKVVETTELRFVPAASLHEDAETAELDPEGLDEPDEIPYAGDVIDLGAVLAEQLALALDPYPRKPGAILPAGLSDSTENPFAALAMRRGKLPDGSN